jgi:ATP-dependent DNA helicase RecG
VVNESYRARLIAFIEKQITEGGQVYVVCPAIEESEEAADEVLLADILTDAPEAEDAVEETDEADGAEDAEEEDFALSDGEV